MSALDLEKLQITRSGKVPGDLLSVARAANSESRNL